ncbi:hypothetical protein A2U01_0099361, partial [Trifolium medium]|nr:hypothetical protein [Trifolium medium]
SGIRAPSFIRICEDGRWKMKDEDEENEDEEEGEEINNNI